MRGFHFPSTRTTNSVRLILDKQYSLFENYIKRAPLYWGLKQVLGTNVIPLRTKFDTQTKRVPAWPLINQLWFPESHFSANCISLRLGEVQMKIYKVSLQALLSCAPRGFAACSRVLARLVSLAQIGELARKLVVVVQWWQRNVQKSVMHVQSCCFVNLNLLFFAVLVDVAVVVAKALYYIIRLRVRINRGSSSFNCITNER